MWNKLGLVYGPDGSMSWAKTHAYCPTPDFREDCIRVYFSSWDENKIGRVGYVDLDKADPRKILKISKHPVLDVGQPGTFDCDGVGPSFVLNDEDKKILYYFGFQRTERKDIHLIFAGAAVSSDDGETFERVSTTPILDRCNGEEFLRSSLSIMKSGLDYYVWYTSSKTGWAELNSDNIFSKSSYPTYTINHIITSSLFDFKSSKSRKVINLVADEFALGRPWVISENGLYKMWYSVRRHSLNYRIGYAESVDGINWVRKDDLVGIDVSMIGWDSEMVCFPTIMDRFMFYNGNKHGESGFGLAVKQ